VRSIRRAILFRGSYEFTVGIKTGRNQIAPPNTRGHSQIHGSSRCVVPAFSSARVGHTDSDDARLSSVLPLVPRAWASSGCAGSTDVAR